MADDVSVSIGAEDTGFQAGLNKAESAVKDASTKIQGSLGQVNAAFERVQKTFMAFTAALAGGAAFKAVIQTSAEWNGESVKLAKALGITTEQASIMKVALNHIGVESDVLVAASQKMSKQVFSNGQAFEKMGIQVKDSAGQYRPVVDVMTEANSKLKEITNPIEQNIAGMQLYGKSWGEVKPLLKLTTEAMEEAKVRAEQLHLVVGPEGAAMARQYKEQMRDLNEVGESLSVQFGNALLPVFTRVGAWMGEEAPAMGNVFKTVLESIAFAVQSLWLALKDMGDGLGALFAQANALLHGDLDAFRAIGKMRDEEAAKNEAAYERLKANFGKDIPAAKSQAPDLSGPHYEFEKEKKDPADKSRMKGWEAELAERKAAYMRSHDMYEMSLTDEKKYWDDLLATLDKGDKEYGAVKKKSAELELSILKKKAEQGRALAQEEVDAWKAGALDGVAAEQQAAQQRYDLGLMTKAELIQQEQKFEDERYEINRQALQARMDLLAKDPNMNPVEYQKLKDQILEIDRKHALEAQALQNKLKLEQMSPQLNVFRSMETSFANAVTGMLTKAQTLRQTLASLFQSIYGTFVQEMVAKPLAQMAMRVIRETALYQTIFGVEKTEQAAAAVEQAATQKALGMSGVMSNAAIAATAAMASVAAIPVVGWAMAPGVGAETYATAMGFLPSARNGFDIPAGMNPVTQLHEREMVLPAAQADAVRDMAANGGASGGDVHLHVHAIDAAGVRDYFKRNSHTLAPGLRQLARNFTSAKV